MEEQRYWDDRTQPFLHQTKPASAIQYNCNATNSREPYDIEKCSNFDSLTSSLSTK